MDDSELELSPYERAIQRTLLENPKILKKWVERAIRGLRKTGMSEVEAKVRVAGVFIDMLGILIEYQDNDSEKDPFGF